MQNSVLTAQLTQQLDWIEQNVRVDQDGAWTQQHIQEKIICLQEKQETEIDPNWEKFKTKEKSTRAAAEEQQQRGRCQTLRGPKSQTWIKLQANISIY